MKKKIISLFLALIIAIGSLTVSFVAFASSRTLILGTKITSAIDGEDDLCRFIFTPSESGTYSFLSYNVPASEAYLFVRENEDGKKVYRQLAYSNSDPNYKENGHNQLQFCLTYHLEKGVKYYFDASWYLSDSRTSGNFTVMLRCDVYDSEVETLTVLNDSKLSIYSDGEWQTDADGNRYFYYNISKIISNLSVTVTYADGRSVTSVGEDTVDGYKIDYKQNQAYVHWYPKSSPDYKSNILTVSVLGKSVDIEIEIEPNSMNLVNGKVVDMLKEPVQNAKIKLNGTVLASTDSNGEFWFYSNSSVLEYSVSLDNAIKREFTMLISVDDKKNDYRNLPIEICTADFSGDGFVNAKDYVMMKKSLKGEEFEKVYLQYKKCVNFSKTNYPKLTLGTR